MPSALARQCLQTGYVNVHKSKRYCSWICFLKKINHMFPRLYNWKQRKKQASLMSWFSPFLWCITSALPPAAAFEVLPWTRSWLWQSSWQLTTDLSRFDNTAHDLLRRGEPGRPHPAAEIRAAGLPDIGSVRREMSASVTTGDRVRDAPAD